MKKKIGSCAKDDWFRYVFIFNFGKPTLVATEKMKYDNLISGGSSFRIRSGTYYCK